MFLHNRILALIACICIFSYTHLYTANAVRIPLDAQIGAALLLDDANVAYICPEIISEGQPNISFFSTQFAIPAGIAPAQAKVNNEDDKPNPLLGKKISHISVLPYNKSLVMTLQEDPTKIYTLLAPNNSKSIIYSCGPLIDSSGSPIQKIQTFECGKNIFIFAAVTSSAANDYQDTNGIAIARIDEGKQENNAIQIRLVQTDPFAKLVPKEAQNETQDKQQNTVATTSKVAATDETNKKEEPELVPKTKPDIRAFPINPDSDFIAFNHPLARAPKITCMHWNSRVEALFVGFDLQAGEQLDAGACALAVGTIDGAEQFKLIPAVANTALTPGAHNEIIAGSGPGASVTLHHITSMHTSTDLDYIIVVGGNGPSDQTKNHVYALPLYAPRDKPVTRGIVADATQPLEFGINPKQYHYVAIRSFKTGVEKPEQVTTNNSNVACVGGKPLPNGSISKIATIGDVVFVSVEKTYDNYKPGIYSSQALFDKQGAIVNWTEWQPVSSIFDATRSFAISYPHEQIMWLSTDAENKNYINYSSLSHAAEHPTPQTKALTQAFEKEGGILFLQAYNTHNPIVGGNPLLIAGSKSKIAFAYNTCSDDQSIETNHIATPLTSSYTLDTNNIMVIEDATLSTLHTLTTAALAGTQDACYLVVGGSKGLAIACTAAGTGLRQHNGSFGFEAHARFYHIGSFASVKKIVADDNYIYVLSQKSLSRIEINTSNFATNTIDITEVAQMSDIQMGAFFDMIIADSCALLATASGLYRLDNQLDIRNITRSNAIWKKIHLPETVIPIIKLATYTKTHQEQDLLKNGGIIHVLGSYRGKNLTHLHRIVVEPTSQVTDSTFTLLSEVYQDANVSNFAGYQTHKELFVTDGATYFSFPSPNNKQPNLECGLERHEPSPLVFNTQDKIHAIIKNSITGEWMIAGTFGLIIH